MVEWSSPALHVSRLMLPAVCTPRRVLGHCMAGHCVAHRDAAATRDGANHSPRFLVMNRACACIIPAYASSWQKAGAAPEPPRPTMVLPEPVMKTAGKEKMPEFVAASWAAAGDDRKRPTTTVPMPHAQLPVTAAVYIRAT